LFFTHPVQALSPPAAGHIPPPELDDAAAVDDADDADDAVEEDAVDSAVEDAASEPPLPPAPLDAALAGPRGGPLVEVVSELHPACAKSAAPAITTAPNVHVPRFILASKKKTSVSAESAAVGRKLDDAGKPKVTSLTAACQAERGSDIARSFRDDCVRQRVDEGCARHEFRPHRRASAHPHHRT
jgi:hypothetical protein